jgi:hypothetical protein
MRARERRSGVAAVTTVLGAVVLGSSSIALAIPKAPTIEITMLHGVSSSAPAIPAGFVIPKQPPWSAYNHWTLLDTKSVSIASSAPVPMDLKNKYTTEIAIAAPADKRPCFEIVVKGPKHEQVLKGKYCAEVGQRFCPAMINPYEGGVLGVCYKLLP